MGIIKHIANANILQTYIKTNLSFPISIVSQISDNYSLLLLYNQLSKKLFISSNIFFILVFNTLALGRD